MHVTPALVTLFSLLDVATALYSGKWCPPACDATLNYVTFNDTDVWLSRKVRSCRSELRITSLYLCFNAYCSEDGDSERWITDQSLWCDEHAGMTLPNYHDVVERWKQGDEQAVRRLTAGEAMASPVLSQVVIPDSSFFVRAFTTMVQAVLFLYVGDAKQTMQETAIWEYNIHLIYGWYMYYFWIVVVAIGMSVRLLSLIQYFRLQNQKYQTPSGGGDLETTTKAPRSFNPYTTWFKRYLIVPATFGDRCSRPLGWCTIPPRVQSLTIFLFIILNIFLCSRSYHLTDGNLYWPENRIQMFRYVSDRTGIISLVNFPLVWLFGMRNDFLMWLTGWGFGTYNAFHRWVARVATVQAVVHSVGYTVMIYENGGWQHFLKYWSKHYFWNGELATIAMCVLVAFSFYGIRRSHYEMFLITHIVLSIVALWTMYYHVEIFTDGEWNIFIWPCLAIWIFDRLLRIGRVLAFNRNPFGIKATVNYDQSSNLVRMEVDSSTNRIKPKPGTYYYIHVLDDLMYAHQSHPFTLAYDSSDLKTASSTSRPRPRRTSSSSSAESTESDALLAPTACRLTSSFVFLIRPYDGFTSRLKSYCLLRPKKLRVLVEGPYGHTIPLHTYPNILFVAGGTGIAVPLSHLCRILQPNSTTQSVKIVWAVREHTFLDSVLRDFRGVLGDERVDMEVHVTREDEARDEVQSEDLKSVRIMTHRPDVRTVVSTAAQFAGHEGLAVVACGPARMADEARQASVEMLRIGHGEVEYFEESFKW